MWMSFGTMVGSYFFFFNTLFLYYFFSFFGVFSASETTGCIFVLLTDILDAFLVGGDILDMALARAAKNARFVMCGAISQYNSTDPKGPRVRVHSRSNHTFLFSSGPIS